MREAADAFDPFAAARDGEGTLDGAMDGQAFVMALGYEDVRSIMGDWRAFSSDAPFRVPIPSEENVRSVRQLPIETDPPDHTAYRALVSEPFSWQTAGTIGPRIEAIVDELLDGAVEQGTIEVVRGFALPLQSRALALMLGRPEEEAAEWLSWGTHVFRDRDESGASHASDLDAYLERVLDEAEEAPGDDFFGLLATARLGDRPLTRDEMMGFANLTFAGGRDTVINAVTNGIHHLCTHPLDMDRIRAEPGLVRTAMEEFLRYFSPVTHLGRVVRDGAELRGRELAPDSVVSVCFAAANRDPAAFERADECLVDRTPNRHLAFGHGPHRCLGVPLAKTIIAAVISHFVNRVGSAAIVSAEPKMEDFGSVQRQVSFERLVLRLSPPGGAR